MPRLAWPRLAKAGRLARPALDAMLPAPLLPAEGP